MARGMALSRSGLERIFLRKASRADLQLDAVDGLRGIAVLFVVLSHMSSMQSHLLPGFDFTGSGKYGVFLFFVLSAFLLTHHALLVTDDRLRGRDYWLGYALRRVFRIYPLYIVVLGTGLLGARFAIPYVIPQSPQTFVAHLLLMEGTAIYWAIPVEFKYYAALPIVALWMTIGLRRRTPVVLGVGLFFIALCATLLWPGAESELNTLSLGPYLPVFVAGSLVAFVHWRIVEGGGVRSARTRAAVEVAGLVSLAVVLLLVPAAWRVISGEAIEGNHFHRQFWLFGLLWSVVLLAILHGSGVLRALFSIRLLRVIGVVSFSVYLWHVSVLMFFGRSGAFDRITGAWIMLVVSVVVAAASYALIERPFLRLGARLGRGRQNEAVSQEAAAPAK